MYMHTYLHTRKSEFATRPSSRAMACLEFFSSRGTTSKPRCAMRRIGLCMRGCRHGVWSMSCRLGLLSTRKNIYMCLCFCLCVSVFVFACVSVCVSSVSASVSLSGPGSRSMSVSMSVSVSVFVSGSLSVSVSGFGSGSGSGSRSGSESVCLRLC